MQKTIIISSKRLPEVGAESAGATPLGTRFARPMIHGIVSSMMGEPRRTTFRVHTAPALAVVTALVGLFAATGCTPTAMPDGDSPDDTPGDASDSTIVWSKAFEAEGVGVLSSVWGSGPEDIFIVGGTPELGEVYHYDGSDWQAVNVPAIPLLVWVFGFAPNDVIAVGEGGGMIVYDGDVWRSVDTGTDADLWGVWGAATDNVWIVGGDGDDAEPIILNYDRINVTKFPVPQERREATALFKVWGIGSKIFAVGGNGLILEFDGQEWVLVPTGPAANEDFVALWGASEDNIVAVGGRTGGRISVYDGDTWTTQLLADAPGLNAVFMIQPDQAVIAGANGYVADFDPLGQSLDPENAGTQETLRAIWADGAGRFYAVGGRFTEPFSGLALVRTIGPADIEVRPPLDAPTLPVALEIGLTNGDPYAPIVDGGSVPLFTRAQGQVHLSLTFRITGFEPDAEIELTGTASLADTGRVIINEFTQSPVFFSEISPGTNEFLDFEVIIDNAFAPEVGNMIVVLTFGVTDVSDVTLTASVTQTVLLTPPFQ